jgi:broad specificity phosphatase PhoE
MTTGALIPDPPDESRSYPPGQQEHNEAKRGYRDEAAAALYKAASAKTLSQAHATVARALLKQAQKIEEHSNTPFTNKQARAIQTMTETLAQLELQMERWHMLIYPNQRPS